MLTLALSLMKRQNNLVFVPAKPFQSAILKTRVKRFARDKHSSLFGVIVGNEENVYISLIPDRVPACSAVRARQDRKSHCRLLLQSRKRNQTGSQDQRKHKIAFPVNGQPAHPTI
jgi:hypothetical protein